MNGQEEHGQAVISQEGIDGDVHPEVEINNYRGGAKSANCYPAATPTIIELNRWGVALCLRYAAIYAYGDAVAVVPERI